MGNGMQTVARKASVERVTNETTIALTLTIEGEGNVRVTTGFGMLDHMLTLTAFWAGFDLDLTCKGDMHIDAHHTAEDVALCLGQALATALDDRKGIARVGFARVPMDEALAEVTLDISGRPWLEWRGDEYLPPVIAGEEKDLWREFHKAFASAARMNLHVSYLYGKNGHHLLESASKGLGLALRQAVRRDRQTVLSTKGSLD
ncbi:imidazoleglycerol-phosphate dehydratase HisB [Nitratidesulfovibrio vulgaris]|jgi:imidazoleglycerol-phosphate dehydratase|nr:imidazoleglycerol-phosphate dehydratase HisB [Nitratidesulfovibrio vulgaris]ADP86123.1 Imidazoleglycerol-phosphate dehydratase [Nitratidesulfovibrio vulgaris RCH1]WCB47676.1 imidazoleglycerol-phosphate dehydratase HisB [Nitratidesulfovibrio vulgaris]